MTEETKQPEQKKEKAPATDAGYYAVILVRGLCEVRGDIKDTVRMLGLTKKNSMVIRKKSDATLGMIRKVKDFVAFGTVSDAIAKEHGVGKTINLHPPRGGFERKGIKVSFSTGGALGNRGEKIADLIAKMHK